MDRQADDTVHQGELIDIIVGRAAVEGCNDSAWPGLTYHRLDYEGPPCDQIVPSLAVCVVAQGRQRVQIDGRSQVCGPSEYFVMPRGARLVTDPLEASCEKPLLSIVLEIDAVVIAELVSEIASCAQTPSAPSEPPTHRESTIVGPLSEELADALLRFLRAMGDELDRRVLAPLALRETTYRVLRTDLSVSLADAAHREMADGRIAAAIDYMRAELEKPIKVEDMANHVSMSVSAFAHLFKATTGSAPYQYLKRLRLDRARALLVEQHLSVSEACNTVGYGSVSHFITEFKRTYGETPRSYASRLRNLGTSRSTVTTG